VNPVQSGVEIRRHFAVQKITITWPVGVGFTSRADGRGGIDDDDGQSVAAPAWWPRIPPAIWSICSDWSGARGKSRPIPLTARGGHPPFWAGRRSPRCWYKRCAGSGPARGFQNPACTLDVHRVHGPVIPQPQMITRRDVKTPIATFQFAFQQSAIEHVAVTCSNLTPASPRSSHSGAQRLHLMSRATNSWTRFEPMNPEAPVTKAFILPWEILP